MSTDIFNPIPFSQCLAAVFLAILFLQSGIDKVTDFAGNLSWLQGHFAKTPFRGQVRNMLVTITIAETLAGGLCAVGAVQLVLSGSTAFALYGAQVAATCIAMLFFGQRIAKDYAGAATLVPYFTLSVGAVLLMRL